MNEAPPTDRPTPDDACAKDHDLVHAVLRGDPGAQARFAERTRLLAGLLAAFNARFGRPLQEHDLADLEQDTIVLILRKLPEYQPLAPLEHWMYGISRLEFRNACRRKRRLARVEQFDGEPPASGFAHLDEPDLGDGDDLERALEELPSDEALIIRWRVQEELSFGEISRRLGLVENTTKTRYRRAMIHLREVHARRQRRQGGGA